MKSNTITTAAIITSLRAKKDGSLGLSISTPELSSEGKVKFLDLQGRNINLLIKPTDEPPVGIFKVKKDMDNKTPSQRLRAVMFIFYKQLNTDEDFNTWYIKKVNKMIENIKNKLEPKG